jgi:Nucleotide-diphospho-sugar transferase
VQIPAAQAGNGDNHAVSALKFRMLRHFLQLGYSVLLSDVVRILQLLLQMPARGYMLGRYALRGVLSPRCANVIATLAGGAVDVPCCCAAGHCDAAESVQLP